MKHEGVVEIVVFVVGSVVGLLLLWLASRSAITLCVLEVQAGELTVVQGALAPRVRSDVEDVVQRAKVAHATIRIVRQGDHAALQIRGDMSDATRQRLRNVVGNVPLAKLKAGGARKRRR